MPLSVPEIEAVADVYAAVDAHVVFRSVLKMGVGGVSVVAEQACV